jgi:hypothetical protein
MSTPSRDEINQRLLHKIDEAAEKATEYHSLTVNDEGTTTNQSFASLMKAREALLQEERRKTRGTFATVNLSKQNF